MKRIILILLTVLCVFSFNSCKKDQCKLSYLPGYKIIGTGSDCYYLEDDSYNNNGNNNWNDDSNDDSNNEGNSGGNNGGNNDNTTYTGTWHIKNQTNNQFKLYVDGYYQGVIDGYANEYLTADVGYYSYRIEQISGYYTYPLEETGSVTIQYNTTTTTTVPYSTKGTIKIVNDEDNPYNLYINDVLQGTIAAYSTESYTVDAWHSYHVYALQKSGYLFYPTEMDWTINVDANYIYTRTIDGFMK